MTEQDAIIRDLTQSIEALQEERDAARGELIHWRGLARALGIAMSDSYEGPVALEREEGDKYRRAVWVLASWIYASTADRAPEGATPDAWVRWALAQPESPVPPPCPSVIA